MTAVGNRRGRERRRGVATIPLRLLEDARENDEELLARASRGDEEAVRRLYRRHVDRVYRCVARILGPLDGDVEDVVQQVFLAALDGADRFGGRAQVGTWIIGIATRRALDEARARQRRARWAKVTEWVGLGRPAARPDVRLGARSAAEVALDTLTPEQRTVFVLHDVEGHTFAEIRDMTNTGISTLHARLKAAHKRLALVVEDWEERDLASADADDATEPASGRAPGTRGRAGEPGGDHGAA